MTACFWVRVWESKFSQDGRGGGTLLGEPKALKGVRRHIRVARRHPSLSHPRVTLHYPIRQEGKREKSGSLDWLHEVTISEWAGGCLVGNCVGTCGMMLRDLETIIGSHLDLLHLEIYSMNDGNLTRNSLSHKVCSFFFFRFWLGAFTSSSFAPSASGPISHTHLTQQFSGRAFFNQIK